MENFYYYVCVPALGLFFLWVGWSLLPTPEPPTVLQPGKVKPPPKLYGKCLACGCVFTVRKQDAHRRNVRGGGPGLWHRCPTDGCSHDVPMSDFHPDTPILPPRGGSAVVGRNPHKEP